MRVTYTPPLMEQIRGNHKRIETGNAKPVCIFIRSCGAYVMQVDPRTHQCTSERQQFIRRADDSLTILPPYQWVSDPDIIEVERMDF